MDFLSWTDEDWCAQLWVSQLIPFMAQWTASISATPCATNGERHWKKTVTNVASGGDGKWMSVWAHESQMWLSKDQVYTWLCTIACHLRAYLVSTVFLSVPWPGTNLGEQTWESKFRWVTMVMSSEASWSRVGHDSLVATEVPHGTCKQKQHVVLAPL